MSDIRKKLAGKKTRLVEPRKAIKDHPADMENFADGSFFWIDVSMIKDNPYQPRQIFDPDSLKELAESIKQNGVLQPIIIRKDENKEIILVAGDRRLRASKMAGLEQVPAILTKGNPMEISLIENLQRENLRPVEEAQALAVMINEHGYTQEKLAVVVGKGRTTITETLSLNKLTEEIKEECRRADNYPRRVLIEVAKQETPEAMTELFYKIRDGQLKSDQVREIVRKPRKPQRTPTALTTEKISALVKSLTNLDLNTAEENERASFLMELQGLKKLVDEIMK